MSRIDELKSQNPILTMNLIDVLNQTFKKTKYVEMSLNLVKNKMLKKSGYDDYRMELVHSYGFTEEELKDKTSLEVYTIFRIIQDYMGSNEFMTLRKFSDLNERKLILNTDLTTYKTFQELDLQMSLAELKLNDKELESQVIKLLDDDRWLVLKPLSWKSSKKYGASTKWCTASENEHEYFYRYARRGILIYAIDKTTGNKVAGFKNIDTSYDRETSFWDIIDQRVDSLECGLPNEVMDIFRNEFNNTKKSNWELLSDDERNQQLIWLESFNVKKMREIPVESLRNIEVEAAVEEQGWDERPTEDNYEMMVEEHPVMSEMNNELTRELLRSLTEDEQPRRGRIIPMRNYDEGPQQAG